jgi:molecular chaperone GrpE
MGKDAKQKDTEELKKEVQAETDVKEDTPEAEKNAKEQKKNPEEKKPSELDQAKAEAEEYKRKWYAVTAEYENYRKRTKDTAAQKYNEGVADILLKIMPIGDNIDRALAVCNDEKMKQGLAMVKTSFEKTLSDEGVEPFDPTGEEFNPATSNAVMAQPAAEGEEAGIVKQTFVKGYKKGDKILRFAQVVVTS